jgi:aspartate/tyrosine/aromatic aminotransferase
MFNTLPLLPADPILGLSQAYAKDTNPLKVDLGVGVYKKRSRPNTHYASGYSGRKNPN